MLIGYVSVAPDEDPGPQIAALRAAGVDTADIHVDTVTALDRTAPRPALDRVRASAGAGTTVTVTALDRLAPGVQPLVALGAGLAAAGADLRVLDDGIDTTTVAGRAQLDLLARLDGLHRRTISTGTRAGLAAARARGRKGGRPAKLTPEQIAHAQQLYDEGEKSLDQIAKIFGVGRTTLYGHLDKSTVGKRPRARRTTPVSAPATTETRTDTNPPALQTVAAAAAIAPAALASPETTTPPTGETSPLVPTEDNRAARALAALQRGRRRENRWDEPAPCPSCGHDPGHRGGRLAQHQDLQISWLEPDPSDDNPGGMIVAHHCTECQPSQRFPITCADPHCDNGPILGGQLAIDAAAPGAQLPELVYWWLARRGWRDTAAGLVCSEHAERHGMTSAPARAAKVIGQD
ncbi:recombinase family protein [Nocardia veterana]|uniref:Recombinase family protein n=1 Tax=Nocardia veterana TaxID=132249 RepID=A0A7X6RK21_9NOCA|nr:recombinase family protein [Nocardia veterana]NKY88852.1 recombinase family protein [Nocardia veterana]